MLALAENNEYAQRFCGVRLIGGSKLPVGVLVSLHGCSSMCGPAMDWQPVQGVALPFAQRELR